MIKTGYVTRSSDKEVEIRIHKESSCGGNCASCRGCGGDEILITAENTINAKNGETVRVVMDNKSFFKSAVLGYIVLVFALIFGGILGYAAFKSDIISALFALFAAAITLMIYKVKFRNKKADIKIERI